MNRTILFTPLGGTDPISADNYRDGSFLHICRVYKPDKIIFYMSKEVLERHHKDNRYLYCLNRLCERISFKADYEIIERTELTDVQQYNFFYEEFTGIIRDIRKGMDESDVLLINISSGTPSMKSGLLVIKTLGEYKCKLIQVLTPQKGMNVHNDRSESIESLWEQNKDNSEEFENRCIEVECPSLSRIKQEEIIKTLIRKYDYEGALQVAELMDDDHTKAYIRLLRIATDRIKLNYERVAKESKECGFACMPVTEENGAMSFEYALALDIKLKRKEYADFIRAITPLLLDLLCQVIEHTVGINIYDYCVHKNVWNWSEHKLKADDTGKKIDGIITKKYVNNKVKFRYEFIKSDNMVDIINTLCDLDKVKKLAGDLRRVELKVRNLAAHEITSLDSGKIISITKLSPEEIMNKIKELFLYTDIDIKNQNWDSYDEMNERIIEQISSNS